MKTSVPVLHSVTDKRSGKSIRVLRQQPRNDRKSVTRRIEALMDGFFSEDRGAGGFAFVIWDKEGANCSGTSAFEGSTVHKADLPNFVYGVLMRNMVLDD